MKRRDLENLLSAHADGLNAGHDLGDGLLAQQPAATAEAARPLLSLAARVQHALRPVVPRSAFVAQLRAQLKAAPAVPVRAARPARQSIWPLLLAALGGLISLASGIVLVFRLVTGMMRWIGEALQKRTTRVPPAKVQSAL